MEYKGVFVLAFIWLPLVSSLPERENLNHDDLEMKAHLGGHKKAGDQESLYSNCSALKLMNFKQSNATPDDCIIIIQWAQYLTNFGEYYGSKAKINLWGAPDMGHHVVTTSSMWISNSVGIDNYIHAGFHVYPDLYNDNELHFYTSWSTDDYNSTGCYNFLCKGFVLVNPHVLTPGDAVNPVSIYGGPQYYITISIKQDPKTRDWLLYREDLNESRLIGYWPKYLFTTLAEKATLVSWGGGVAYPKNKIGPPMGSGHYPIELQGKAAFIKNIEVFDLNGGSLDLKYIVNPHMSRKSCYNVTRFVDSRKYGLNDGYLFYFGGPSGCTN